MFECPIIYYKEHLEFSKDKSCWALFKLTGESYEFKSMEQKIQMLYRTAAFLADISAEAQIWLVPVKQDIEKQYEIYQKNLYKEDPLYNRAVQILDLTKQYLKNDGVVDTADSYKTYICIKLAKSSDELENFKEAFTYVFKDPINAFHTFMQLDTRDILKSQVEFYQETAKNIWESQNMRIGMEPVAKEEHQWFLRRMSIRGLNKETQLWYEKNQEIYEPIWEEREFKSREEEKIIRPYTKDVQTIFDGTITPRNRYIEVDTDGEISYQSFLVVTHLPEEQAFPGCEWIYQIQERNLQTELYIHVKSVNYQKAKKKVEDKKQEIKSQIKNIAEAEDEIPDELLEGKNDANYIKKELDISHTGILMTTIIMCVAADSKQELERKVRKVRRIYEDMNFVIERPFTDQYQLYCSLYPTVSPTQRSYVQPLLPTVLAGGIIGATQEIGDVQGIGQSMFVGTTGLSRKNVFLNMSNACLHNKSASAAFLGDLGYGKSFNANVLTILHIILAGGYGLIFDPKAERGHWEKELDILAGMIKTITLTAKRSDRGKLDPFNVYRNNIDMACDLAGNILIDLLAIEKNSDLHVALLTGLQVIKKEQNLIRPSMKRLEEIVGAFHPEEFYAESGKRLAKMMSLQKDIGKAQLIFGDGSEEVISIDNRLNIIQIEDLQLPEKDTPRSDYKEEEKVAVAVFAICSHFAKQFALETRDTISFILMDEFGILGKTMEGINVSNWLARMGRSLFTAVLFNGHSVTDIPNEGIKNAITYKFIFHTSTTEEAVRMLEFLKLEVSQDNINTLLNLQNRECIFQDEYGRTSRLTFDAVFQDFIDVFSTTPTQRKEETKQQEISKKDLFKREIVS